MKPSKYLEKFQQLAPSSFQLNGNFLLVEKVPHEEYRTEEGLYFASAEVSARQIAGIDPERRLSVVRVLKAGEGYYDDAGQHVPLDVAPGNIIEVPWTSLFWYSAFAGLGDYEPDSIGLTAEGNIRMLWADDAAYENFWGKLNK